MFLRGVHFSGYRNHEPPPLIRLQFSSVVDPLDPCLSSCAKGVSLDAFLFDG